MYGKTRAFYSVAKREKDMNYVHKVLVEKYDMLVDSQDGKAVLTENVTEGNVD